MAEFVAVRDGDAPWAPVFAREGISQALLATDSDLVAEIAASGWETVYRDEDFVVLRP